MANISLEVQNISSDKNKPIIYSRRVTIMACEKKFKKGRPNISLLQINSSPYFYHSGMTTLPAEAWFAARLLPKFFLFDSLAILDPN